MIASLVHDREEPMTARDPGTPSTPTAADALCALCGRRHPTKSLVHARGIRPGVTRHLTERYAERWKPDSHVCRDCLNKERLEHLVARLAEDRGELSEIESDVARKAVDHLAIAEHVEEEFRRSATFGQRLADAVARIGGSWPFVVGFILVLLAWIGLNTWMLRGQAFDPYPYILLNLVLSCIAALQAPIIMMSQNRSAEHDRRRAEQDFRVNLKAELEIASLHDKVDHLLHAQWEHLVEMQEMQIDLLTQIAEKRGSRGPQG
jgi:uncharacterized membrane protein